VALVSMWLAGIAADRLIDNVPDVPATA
jgi:hypothetical protein